MQHVIKQLHALDRNVTLVGFADPAELDTLIESTTHSFLLGVAFYKDDNGRRSVPGLDVSAHKVQ